jgi:hypothetical protein
LVGHFALPYLDDLAGLDAAASEKAFVNADGFHGVP